MTTGTANSRAWRCSSLCVLGALALFALVGCKSPGEQTAGAKRYALKGTVVSVNAGAKSASIDTEEIPGFMMPMTMDYDVHDAAALAKLKPKDKVTADLIVDPSGSYVENVKVVGEASEGPK